MSSYGSLPLLQRCQIFRTASALTELLRQDFALQQSITAVLTRVTVKLQGIEQKLTERDEEEKDAPGLTVTQRSLGDEI